MPLRKHDDGDDDDDDDADALTRLIEERHLELDEEELLRRALTNKVKVLSEKLPRESSLRREASLEKDASLQREALLQREAAKQKMAMRKLILGARKEDQCQDQDRDQDHESHLSPREGIQEKLRLLESERFRLEKELLAQERETAQEARACRCPGTDPDSDPNLS